MYVVIFSDAYYMYTPLEITTYIVISITIPYKITNILL